MQKQFRTEIGKKDFLKGAERFTSTFSELYPDGEYVQVGQYAGCNVPVRVRHEECGWEWDITPSNFYKGKRCPACSGRGGKTHTLDERRAFFLRRVERQFGGVYTILGEYVDSMTPLEVRHEECGRIFSISPCNLVKRTAAPRCTHCSREQRVSQGEQQIMHWLDEHAIAYIHQWRADPLNAEQASHRYTFDFRVETSDGGYCLVEYQGEFHFRPWRGDSRTAIAKFENTVKNDAIKADFCARHGIPLLTIPYSEFYRISDRLGEFFDLSDR